MNKLDEIRNKVETRGKSLLGAVADIIETISEQNLAFASDFADFAVAQVRLPTKTNDFGDYRDRSKDAFSKFGTTVKGHGEEMVAVIRDVPSQIRSSLTVKAKPAKKAKAKKTAAKKKAVK